MQTFLNAMTFPDKTISGGQHGDQDLLNADVCLDAVLHPAIYRKRAIFEQEGWHYELGGDTEAERATRCRRRRGRHGSRRRVCAPRAERRGVQPCRDEGRAVRSEFGAVRRAAGGAVPRHIRFEVGRHAAPSPTSPTSSSWRSTAATAWTTAPSLYGDLDLDGMLAFLDERYLSPSPTSRRPRRASARGASRPHELREQAPMRALGVKEHGHHAENACARAEPRHRQRVRAHARRRGHPHRRHRRLERGAAQRALLDAGLAATRWRSSPTRCCSRSRSSSCADWRKAVPAFPPGRGKRCASWPTEGSTARSWASLSRAEFVAREREYSMPTAWRWRWLAGGLAGDDDAATSYLKYEDDFAFLRKALDEGISSG